MEQDVQLDLEWVPDALAGIFEDAHADHCGQWESIDAESTAAHAACESPAIPHPRPTCGALT